MHQYFANTNVIGAVEAEQVFIRLANNAENGITGKMNCSKCTAIVFGSCERTDTDDLC